MSNPADIRSFEALLDTRVALISFAENARASLGDVDANVKKMMSWLENDRPQHWKRELKRRERAMADAKLDLQRCLMNNRNDRGRCLLEKRRFDKCERAVEEAKQKLVAIRKWRQMFPREVALYKAQTGQLGHAADHQVPVAVAELERMARALEAYVQTKPVHGKSSPSPRRPSAGQDGNMSPKSEESE
ncbi:MAG: hypothetical protein P8J86_08850 [Phycisphaerales bacterium]|nr:hypothetical protein [Phycisphaerales bacterium]